MKTLLISTLVICGLFFYALRPAVAQETDGDGSSPISQDAAAPVEEHEAAGILAEASSADIVAQATLVSRVSVVAAPKRVVNTIYTFQISEWISTGRKNEFIKVYDTGGALRDGTTMDTADSFNLAEGKNFLIFATLVGDQYWLKNVVQIVDDNQLADAQGRAVIGVSDGRLLTQESATAPSLRYSQPIGDVRPRMEGPPQTASLPLPAVPAQAPQDAAEPLKLEKFKQLLKSSKADFDTKASLAPQIGNDANEKDASGDDRHGDDTDGDDANADDANADDANADALDAGGIAPQAMLSGDHMRVFQSHYHFMPNDDQWSWSNQSRENWDRLVRPKAGLRLFAYKVRNGQPIRNELPVANNGRFNLGVLNDAQMVAGGYDTWAHLGANGVCYRWRDSSRAVQETDILINPAIASDEAQFRKSLTHELGHALTLDHETRYMALLYPGTYQQPPNYASIWYSRQDDLHGVRSMLSWVNANVAAGTWDVDHFTDMATWSLAHSNPGTNGTLVMTNLSALNLARGATANMQNVHLENRGNDTATNVTLKFYLSSNDSISASDIEIGSYVWSSFTNWWTGALAVRVPNNVPPGSYFVGWIVTTNSPEISSGNNTAILLNGYQTGFTKVKVQVN